jgi:hypothetical protein
MTFTTNQLAALTRLADQVQDWGSYAERHPTVPYTDEWARELLRSFLAIVEPARWRVICEDGAVRHHTEFHTRHEAEVWADQGHACTRSHTFVEMPSQPERVRSYDRDGDPHDDVIRTKSGRVLTEADILALAEEAERGYDIDPTRIVSIGARRVWRDLPNRRGPFTVLRINALTREVYVQWDDKTTAWMEFSQYLDETVPSSEEADAGEDWQG